MSNIPLTLVFCIIDTSVQMSLIICTFIIQIFVYLLFYFIVVWSISVLSVAMVEDVMYAQCILHTVA